jgi:hypothetical protein
MKLAYTMDTPFTKLRLCLIISTLLPPLFEALYVGHVQLFAEASELFTHALFSRFVIYKMVSSECLLPGAKKVEGGGCKIGTVGGMGENNLPHCYICIPCAQTGVRSGAVKQETLIHVPGVVRHFNNTQNI